jgi:hypothetical protein
LYTKNHKTFLFVLVIDFSAFAKADSLQKSLRSTNIKAAKIGSKLILREQSTTYTITKYCRICNGPVHMCHRQALMSQQIFARATSD